MRLYLVQHGEALAKEVDPERRLSAGGRRDVRRLAEMLAKSGLRIPKVLHSGKARARETAELLAAALAPDGAPGGAVEAATGLGPNDPAAAFAATLSGSGEDLLVVGHLPFMARLVSRLVAGREEPALVAYLPGSMVCLERGEGGGWSLAWMLRPELLA